MRKVFWTYERCKDDALKYETRSEFRNKSRYVYDICRKNDWLDEMCLHMKTLIKPNGYWDFEKCKEEALRYEKRSDFKTFSSSAYNTALKNMWLDEICSHMIEIKKHNGYWTKERCQNEALKYETKKDFRDNNNNIYNISSKNKWLDEICSHMTETKKPKGYWTYERCKDEALKYETRSSYNQGSKSYQIALKNKWLDDICSHMIKPSNDDKRCVYVFEFSDNFAYVGLTKDIKKRHYQHKKKGSVFNHIKINDNYQLKQLSNYVSISEAKLLEKDFYEKYKKNGWNMLNKSKTGGIGNSSIIWTKERCQDEALKYNNKGDFFKKSSNAYYASIRNKWITDICSHMIIKIKPKDYWTKERCQDEALKYNNTKEFSEFSPSAYHKSIKNKWLYDICSHMTLRKQRKTKS